MTYQSKITIIYSRLATDLLFRLIYQKFKFKLRKSHRDGVWISDLNLHRFLRFFIFLRFILNSLSVD